MRPWPEKDHGFAAAIEDFLGEFPEESLKETPLSVRDLRRFFEMGFRQGETSRFRRWPLKSSK